MYWLASLDAILDPFFDAADTQEAVGNFPNVNNEGVNQMLNFASMKK